MRSFIFIFVILLAIPTLGASLVIYFIVVGVKANRGAKKLVQSLLLSHESGRSVELNVSEPASVMLFFKRFAVDEVEVSKFPNGVSSYSATLLVPELGEEVIVTAVHDRTIGFVTLGCDAVRKLESVSGESPQDTVNRIMKYLRN